MNPRNNVVITLSTHSPTICVHYLLVIAVPALDLALAAALEVLLHLHLHADLVALVGVQRAPSQKDLKQKHRVSDLELGRFQK